MSQAFDVVVIGAGPGGYIAAIRAALSLFITGACAPAPGIKKETNTKRTIPFIPLQALESKDTKNISF